MTPAPRSAITQHPAPDTLLFIAGALPARSHGHGHEGTPLDIPGQPAAACRLAEAAAGPGWRSIAPQAAVQEFPGACLPADVQEMRVGATSVLMNGRAYPGQALFSGDLAARQGPLHVHAVRVDPDAPAAHSLEAAIDHATGTIAPPGAHAGVPRVLPRETETLAPHAVRLFLRRMEVLSWSVHAAALNAHLEVRAAIRAACDAQMVLPNDPIVNARATFVQAAPDAEIPSAPDTLADRWAEAVHTFTPHRPLPLRDRATLVSLLHDADTGAGGEGTSLPTPQALGAFEALVRSFGDTDAQIRSFAEIATAIVRRQAHEMRRCRDMEMPAAE